MAPFVDACLFSCSTTLSMLGLLPKVLVMGWCSSGARNLPGTAEGPFRRSGRSLRRRRGAARPTPNECRK